ncbi:hypothetical protein [Methanobrevibacter arboriphilus]|uniref:hypothetical protein n=1 Tax=Methanobrevibacter arboriphilus TaxID=39441 RepID=UPI00241DC1FC|nr:hypothetical protein [Methanobrevibacter arboriphilus]
MKMLKSTIDGKKVYYDEKDHLWRMIDNGRHFIPRLELLQSYALVIEHLKVVSGRDDVIVFLEECSESILPTKE